MIITTGVLEGLFRNFNTSFNKGFEGAPSQYSSVAMAIPSNTAETTYGWIGQMPTMREWLGDRIIKSFTEYGFTIVNRKFESTISVPRERIEDDQFGIYGPMITDLGRAAKENADVLVFGLLSAGFATPCYDGQYFFDAEHPVANADGTLGIASNVAAGDGPAWYLFDTSRSVKAMIFQERIRPEFQHLDREDNTPVFMRDEYTYGVRARANAGFGLWQLAYASQEPLTPDNYAAARQAMMTLRGDEGRLLGIKPDTLVYPPSLEPAALALLNSTLINATTNPWVNTAKGILSPWLAT